MKRNLTLFALGIASALAPAAVMAKDPALSAHADRVADNYMTAPIAGMTIAIARPGEPVLVRAYGYADLEARRPMQADSRFEIGSITKQFTAAAVLRLAEEGRLSLASPVSDYFPELAVAAQGATIEHLLRHSSGLSSARVAEDLTAPLDPSAVVAFVAGHAPEFAPGERYRYNNNGYILLGLVAEKVTGKPFSEHLSETFFTPLGLSATGVCEAGDRVERLPSYLPPARDGEVFRRAPSHHPSAGFSAGFLCSTAGDIARWSQALANGRVVSAESLAAMTTPSTGKEGVRTNYGMGTEIGREGDALHHYHGGATSGFFAQSGYWPADGTSVVVLTNGAYAGSLLERIEADLHRASLGDARTYAARTVAEPARYEGEYELAGLSIAIYSQGGYLRMEPRGQAPTRLLVGAEGEFVAEHDPAIQVRFAIGASDKAESLTIVRNGRAMPPALRAAS